MTTISNGTNGRTKAANHKKEVAPAAASPSVEATAEIVKLGGGKPDLNHHHAQLDRIKADIDKKTSELVSIRERCS
jgi:hypothetical protein